MVHAARISLSITDRCGNRKRPEACISCSSGIYHSHECGFYTITLIAFQDSPLFVSPPRDSKKGSSTALRAAPEPRLSWCWCLAARLLHLARFPCVRGEFRLFGLPGFH